jgi:hypothetical protein
MKKNNTKDSFISFFHTFHKPLKWFNVLYVIDNPRHKSWVTSNNQIIKNRFNSFQMSIYFFISNSCFRIK